MHENILSVDDCTTREPSFPPAGIGTLVEVANLLRESSLSIH